jgi:hypothetical protein
LERFRTDIEAQKARFARMAEERRREWRETEPKPETAPKSFAVEDPLGGPGGAEDRETEAGGTTAPTLIPFRQAQPDGAEATPAGSQPSGGPPPPHITSKEAAALGDPGDTLIEQLTRKHLRERPTLSSD